MEHFTASSLVNHISHELRVLTTVKRLWQAKALKLEPFFHRIEIIFVPSS